MGGCVSMCTCCSNSTRQPSDIHVIVGVMTYMQRAKHIATHIAVGAVALVIGAASAAAAAPARAVMAAAPTAQNCSVVAGAAPDQWVISCTITGLVTPAPTASPSPSSSPSPSPSVSPSASPSASPTPTGDRTPPSTPTGLTAAPRSPNSLMVTWNASTDNIGVTGYRFYRGTTLLGTTATPDWLDTRLQPDTAYSYSVRAVDAAGNLSPFSAVLSARTPANPPPTTGNNCQANPEGCGFPGPNNTGASAATTTLNGNQTFNVAGATISNTRINGCVEVRANNITFRNVFVNAPASCFWVVNNFATGLQIIDSTITGNGGNGNCVGSSGLSLLRVELTGCENGLNVSGTTTVTDSWIHDLTTANGAHTDGAQFNEGARSILFQHNTIIMPTPGSTAAIIMWDEGGSQNANVSIVSNLLAGGTYTLYCGREGAVVNVQIANNRFGTFQYKYSDACDSGEVWSGNVRDSDGASIPAE